MPNGIVWDRPASALIVVPFGGTTIFTGREGRGAMPLTLGPGQQDGVVMLDGRILVSSWADSSVSEVGPNGIKKVITGVPTPADIGLDVAGRRLAIPLFTRESRGDLEVARRRRRLQGRTAYGQGPSLCDSPV